MPEAKTTRLRASNELKNVFAQRVLARLKDEGLTQTDFADKIDMSKDAVSTYCRGRSIPSEQTLNKMAKVLGVEPGDLLPLRFDSVTEVPVRQDFSVLSDGDMKVVLNVVLPMKAAQDIQRILASANINRE